jgi:hypothetical protein
MESKDLWWFAHYTLDISEESVLLSTRMVPPKYVSIVFIILLTPVFRFANANDIATAAEISNSTHSAFNYSFVWYYFKFCHNGATKFLGVDVV